MPGWLSQQGKVKARRGKVRGKHRIFLPGALCNSCLYHQQAPKEQCSASSSPLLTAMTLCGLQALAPQEVLQVPQQPELLGWDPQGTWMSTVILSLLGFPRYLGVWGPKVLKNPLIQPPHSWLCNPRFCHLLPAQSWVFCVFWLCLIYALN